MAASDIREHKIAAAAAVFYFARAYSDERSSAAAYERARAKISAQDNTSVFRVTSPTTGANCCSSSPARLLTPSMCANASHWAATSTPPHL